MFTKHTAFYLQKMEKFARQTLVYSINANERVIGAIRETENSRKTEKSLLKWLSLLFLSIHKRTIIEHLELEIFDEDEVVGKVRKKEGYFEDFLLYTMNEEHIATVQPTVKLTSPSITVIDANGESLVKATGNTPYAFRVYDCRTDKQISSIKRRSLVYRTMKESLFDTDVYHLDHNHQESIITFALIGMVMALDIYFFPGE